MVATTSRPVKLESDPCYFQAISVYLKTFYLATLSDIVDTYS